MASLKVPSCCCSTAQDSLVKELLLLPSVKESDSSKTYVFDGFAGADPNYALSVRILAKKAWQAHFVHNMFIRPKLNDLDNFEPDFTIINASDLKNVDYKKFGMNYKIDLIFTNAEFEDSVIVEGQPHYENCEGCDAPCESKCPMGCKMDFDLVDWEKCANFVDVPEAFKNLDTICRICQEECPYSEDLRKEILSIDVNYGGRINA